MKNLFLNQKHRGDDIIFTFNPVDSVNFEMKDFETIFKEAIVNAQEMSFLSDDEDFISHIESLQDIENFYVMDLSVVAVMIARAFVAIGLVYDSNDINVAVGRDLDKIGDWFSIERPSAKKSVVELQFYIESETDSDIVIPEGTIVQTENQEQYVTDETVIITEGSTSTTVNARSVLTGYASRVNENTLTDIVSTIDSNNAHLYVTNPQNSSDGRNSATDDEYRELIRQWKKTLIRGTKSAYKYFFEHYEGIDGYHLVPLWDGTGTLKVIIDPDDERIIQDIQEKLSDNVAMADDDIIVEGATRKTININCSVNVDIDELIPYSAVEKEDIRLRVENSIKTFINGGFRRDGSYYSGLTIGEDFIAHKCYVFVDSEVPELKTIEFVGFGNYFPVSDVEIAEAGVINVIIE